MQYIMLFIPLNLFWGWGVGWFPNNGNEANEEMCLCNQEHQRRFLITSVSLLWAVELSHLRADALTAVNLHWYVYELSISYVHPLIFPWNCLKLTRTAQMRGHVTKQHARYEWEQRRVRLLRWSGRGRRALCEPSKCHLSRCRFSESISASAEFSVVSQTISVPKWNHLFSPPPPFFFFFSFQWHKKQKYSVFFQLWGMEMPPFSV